jgi:subtilisin family serine protease
MRRLSPLLFLVLLAGIALAALPRAASGAIIHEGLERHLMTLRDTDRVSVILFMREQADVAALDAQLRETHSSLAQRNERVLLALRDASRSQHDLLAALDAAKAAGEVTGYTSYWIANLVVAEMTKAAVYRLAARGDIEQIEINFRTEMIDTPPAGGGEGPSRGIGVTPGLRAINAPRVWHELGINGAGTIIGGCDTGVDGTHPALASRWRGNFAPVSQCWLNTIGGHPDFPYDGYGHGTHTMGTMTGLGATTQDTIGVAWGALWISADPINQDVGGEFDNDVIHSYQWFADPDGVPGTHDDEPDVVQNSWGVYEGLGYPDCDSRWYTVIDNCEAAGVATCWSAGNEGPTAGSLRSPADRGTTLTNAFSVGAIDATNYSFPYPIAGFSSRGPSGCNVPTPNKVKPEVVAPGVDVYSSVPGGGYEQTQWDGTSMAGPHVAGIMALMRQANPDLDVVTMKEILMDTAIDLGPAGEENTYGWGIPDAYAAVTAAMAGYGVIQGTVRNLSSGNAPVPGATVEAVEATRTATTNTSGQYTIHVPAGTYTVRATHPSFTTGTRLGVVVAAGGTATVDFALTDVGAPAIAGTTLYRSTEDQIGPYWIQTTVTDYSQLQHVSLIYRTNGGAPQTLAMTLSAGLYRAGIPGQPHTTHVEYYVDAQDIAGNRATDPAGAPAQMYDFFVAPKSSLLSDAMEDGQGEWTHAGVTPSYTDQWHLSTTRNHTAGGATSWKCGDTGTATYANLLDAGLTTPSFTLGIDSYLHYWQWMAAETSAAHAGYAYDGGIVELSLDGGAWQQITPVGGYPFQVRAGSQPGPFPAGTPMFSGNRDWREIDFDLSAYDGPAQIRFRFGSDGATGREGWYVDDLVVDGFNILLSGAPEAPGPLALRLQAADPNPFNAETRVRYQLAASADVLLQIFDPTGRLVRTLLSGRQGAGQYEIRWDGRDAGARPVPAGLYLTRVQAGPVSETAKVILTR